MIKKTKLFMILSISFPMLGCSYYQLSSMHSAQEDLNKPNTISQYDKKLILSYDISYKEDILKALHSKNINVVYDLKNMNILVISIHRDKADQEINELKNIKGVFDIREDSTISIN